MGCITLVLKDGEGVAVDVPCRIKIRKVKGRGKNRRRCEVQFNEPKAIVKRVNMHISLASDESQNDEK